MASSPPPQPAPRDLAARLGGCFRGELPPAVASVPYQIALLLVAAAVVVLPLLYLSLIGLTGWAVVEHAVRNFDLLTTGRGNAKGRAFLYLAPIAIGGIVILFLVKPLFAKDAQASEPRCLKPEDEPLLFAFVAKLCAAIGAPQPVEIAIDHAINASAGPQRGFLSLLSGRLRLTFGLPLAAALPLDAFAGILAHEFGHFAQTRGTRLSYVIRSINLWFARVVHGRDAWDERLAQWAKEGDLRLRAVLQAARLCVWLTRRILHFLMGIGHLLSCALTRQMEYDADRCATLLTGGHIARLTLTGMPLLELASARAGAGLDDLLAEGRLPESWPHRIAEEAEGITPADRRQLEAAILGATTGWFSTHPSASDRIARAEEIGGDGVFCAKLLTGQVKPPAALLFRDFPALCREASRDLYRESFGEAAEQASLCATEELTLRRREEDAANEAFRRLFGDEFPLVRTPDWAQALPARPAGPAAFALAGAREEMARTLPAWREAYREFDRLDTMRIEIGQGAALLEAGFRIARAEFHLGEGSDAAARAFAEVDRKTKALDELLLPWEEAMLRRFGLALGLLTDADFAAPLEDAAVLRTEAMAVLPALVCLRSSEDEMLAARNCAATLASLLRQFESHAEDEDLQRVTRAAGEALRGALATAKESFSGATYPLDHAQGTVGLADHILPRLPESGELGELLGANETALRNFFRLRHRLTARLCRILGRIEEAAGLPLPPAPPADEDAA